MYGNCSYPLDTIYATIQRIVLRTNWVIREAFGNEQYARMKQIVEKTSIKDKNVVIIVNFY